MSGGSTYDEGADSNYWGDILNTQAGKEGVSGDELREGIGIALNYGCKDPNDTTGIVATQLLLWELVGYPGYHNTRGNANQPIMNPRTFTLNRDSALVNHIYNIDTGAVSSRYNDIVNKCKSYVAMKSLPDGRYELVSRNGRFEYSFTLSNEQSVAWDTFGCTSKLNASGLGVNKSGNNITIYSDTAFAGDKNVEVVREVSGTNTRIFECSGSEKNSQTAANTGGVNLVKNMRFYINTGKMSFTKYYKNVEDDNADKASAENNKFLNSGATFKVKQVKSGNYITANGTNGVYSCIGTSPVGTEFKLDNNGNIFIENLQYGDYIFEEIDSTKGYEPIEPIPFTINNPNTITIGTEDTNTDKQITGGLEIHKESEDNIIKGHTFHITRKFSDNDIWNADVVTDDNGVVSLSNLPVYSNNGDKILYRVEEIKVDTEGNIRYRKPDVWETYLNDDGTVVSNDDMTKDYHKVIFNQLKTGELQVTKTSDDGYNGKRTFKVTVLSEQAFNYGSTYTITTNDDGIAHLSGMPVYDSNNEKIEYKIEEINVPTRYEIPANQTTTLVTDDVVDNPFENKVKRGQVKIHKQVETANGTAGELADTFVDKSGVEFTVEVISDIPTDNKSVQHGDRWTITTDANGIAQTEKELPIYYKDKNGIDQKVQYLITETPVSEIYVIPTPVVVTLNENGTMTNAGEIEFVEFKNILKKFNLEVTKKDSETVTAQGNATLAGAVYGVYKDGVLVDEYTTDVNGYFKTKEYVCGNYTLKEIKPSEGYLLDETEYDMGAEAKNYFVESNLISMDAPEDVIKNHIDILKYVPKIQNYQAGDLIPEEGAAFELYLKSAGSYANAKESERDSLVCDENGYARSKDLPYGTYTVHQTEAWDGAVKVDDFDVTITVDSDESEPYTYPIINPMFEARIKIVKKDVETGKTIPYAGAGFQIYREDHSLVSMNKAYPTPETIDTFYTNDEGYLYTPFDLIYGKYYVREVQAPYGYVLDSEEVEVNLTEENSTKENAFTIVLAEKSNIAQKGTISVHKTGEIFSTVTQANGEYTPVFRTGNVAGAEFNIVAAEDIITGDGTVRAKKGDIVTTIITDANGNAQTSPLYLGKYTVVEAKAPFGHLLDSEPQTVVLSYAGQDIEVLDTIKTDFTDSYQTISISLKKVMEQNELFGIGMNGEYKAVRYGLFADEEIIAADGTVIPKDGLIKTLVLDENQKAQFDATIPFGKYYVKEIATDKHYVLNGEKYLITYSYAGQDIPTVVIDCGTFENDLIMGAIRGRKESSKDGKPLGNAVFGLFSADETVFDTSHAYLTAVSDTNGYFTFSDIPYGTYIIAEIEAPSGYIYSDETYEKDITIDGQVVEFTAKNTPIEIDFSKEDIYGKELAGATLVLRDTNGNVVDSWVSDGTNHRVSELPVGDYVLHEEISPDGYVLATDIKFSVDKFGVFTSSDIKIETSTEIPVITMVDDTTKIEISKQSVTGSKELAGAVLQIIDKDNNVIEEWTSDTQPHFFEAILKAGETYRLHETIAPNGYVIAHDITFTVSMDGSIDSVTMKDDTTKVNFSKKDITNDEEVVGAKLEILDDKGNVVDSWTSEKTTHYIEALLTAGKEYTLRETYAPDGYIVAHDVTFTVSIDGTIDYVEMFDDTTKVNVSKKDITNGEELEGAELEIRDADGNTVEKWVSTNETHFIEGKLTAGKTYTLTETYAPDGYVISDTIEFTVSTDGSIDYVEMFDDTTKVEITKKKITDGEELAGAELTITDEDGTVIDKWTSTTESHYIEGKLVAGKTYTLHEVYSPDGYAIANDVEFTVSEDGSIDVVEMIDDTTKVRIFKKDDTEQFVVGATMQLLDKDGKIVDEWITDTAEHFIEAKLIAGQEYTLHEVSAPDGYAIAEDIVFTVSTDGSEDVVTMYDMKMRTSGSDNSSPKTGDTLPLVNTALLILITLALAVTKRSLRTQVKSNEC